MNIYIVYELRNREYDTILLLKSELISRGYNVEVINKQTMFKWFYKEAIIIIPNCYNTNNYDFYNYRLNAKNNHIINLQIEQVISIKSEENGFFNPKGKAKRAIHLCWGMNNFDRLKQNQINSTNLSVTGAIHLDFLRPQFEEFWYSKAEIAEMFGIPLNKKWVLYISSFSYVNNTEVIKTIQKDFGGEDKSSYLKEFEQISTDSQKITLDWLERYVEENEDVVVIYRRHPAETKNERIIEIANKNKESFYNIAELNIKQWIHVSDQIVTWFSTSIVESYTAKKMCYILRPYTIPKEIDAIIYHNAHNILNSYESFNYNMKKSENSAFDNDFPISKESINEFYLIDKIPSFIKVANLIDEVSKTGKLKPDFSYLFKRVKYLMKNNVILKYYFKKIYQLCYEKFQYQINVTKIRKKWAFENLEKEIDDFDFNIKDSENKMEKLNRIRGYFYE